MTAPFNVGHDATVDIVDGPTGRVITTFPPTTHFTFKPTTKTLESDPVNGEPIFREIPRGWEGTIEYDRVDPSIDNYFVGQEDAYWANGSYTPGTITQTVQEANGAVSQYKYTNAALKFDDAGAFKADEKVMLKLSWKASRRRRII